MEHVNRIIEDMLRHYVNPMYDDWDEFLDKVEVAYNDSIQKPIWNTPFVLNSSKYHVTPINAINRC
jgi:hypothetical protein